MIGKEIERIEEADLQHLIDDQIIENKTLEYKSILPGNSDKDKREFKADVSSFANASGGDIIYGIKEDKGAPLSPLEGIIIEDIDKERLRLDGMIKNGIDPNIPSSGIDIHPIKLTNDNFVIIIRIKRSWLGPHRVTFKGWNQFFARSTAGKYQLDVQELRASFILSETLQDKINKFREKRISAIYANELPIPFYPSPKVALHLIPFSSFNPGQRYDLETIEKISLYDIQPLGKENFNHRYNIDGLLTFSSFPNKKDSYSYVQLYRNGIIEAVNSELLWSGDRSRYINPTLIEKAIVESIPNYMEVCQKFNIDPPIFLFLTLVDVKDYVIPSRASWNLKNPIDRDILLIPEVIIEDLNFEPSLLLKPIFDSIWNACGFHRSPNYDNEGKWNPNRK